MTKLSKHFMRSEFGCKCGCGFDTVDIELLELLEHVREHFGQPVSVTSGCRCEAHNASVGGSEGSQHIRGRAADIVVANTSPAAVQVYVDAINPAGGMGRYAGFTHIDTRNGRARWQG